jgi:hypothetical protein
MFSGNLTKHILKHHRGEQRELIPDDCLLSRKGKKSVKDPAAIDFIEKVQISVLINLFITV